MNFLIKIYNKLFYYLEKLIHFLVRPIPYFDFIEGTKNAEIQIKFSDWLRQVLFSPSHRFLYWPVHPSSKIAYFKNIKIGVDTCPGYMRGCYIQGKNGIEIGDYTQISANVGIQSAQHDLYNLRNYKPCKPIKIGKYCLVAMNVMILPEVELGDFTIVGAGAVVTKSFPEGYCVIAGNPAKKLRDLDPAECIRYKDENEYIGFIKKEKFEQYKRKYLK